MNLGYSIQMNMLHFDIGAGILLDISRCRRNLSDVLARDALGRYFLPFLQIIDVYD